MSDQNKRLHPDLATPAEKERGEYRNHIANRSGVSSVAASCSHGGEETLGTVARSHDSALIEQATIVLTLTADKRLTFASMCLDESRRLGPFVDSIIELIERTMEVGKVPVDETAVDRQSAAAEGQSSATTQGTNG